MKKNAENEKPGYATLEYWTKVSDENNMQFALDWEKGEFKFWGIYSTIRPSGKEFVIRLVANRGNLLNLPRAFVLLNGQLSHEFSVAEAQEMITYWGRFYERHKNA